MPPVRGLYAAALPPLLAAVFASSPWLQTGPVALTALLTFGALAARTTPGSDEYIAEAALLALIVGASRLAIGLLRAGAVTYLMSHAVLRGFTLGAALLIGASQIPSILGASPQLEGILARAGVSLLTPELWNWEAIGFAGLTMALIVGGRLIHSLFPGLLVAVIVAIGISKSLGYDGIQVGPIPPGLPEIPVEPPLARNPKPAASGYRDRPGRFCGGGVDLADLCGERATPPGTRIKSSSAKASRIWPRRAPAPSQWADPFRGAPSIISPGRKRGARGV